MLIFPIGHVILGVNIDAKGGCEAQFLCEHMCVERRLQGGYGQSDAPNS